ncbi:MAG: GAF domain-containing protein [Nitrospirae bacterium]|nr:GAF domain-containing protein [Candidatus Manganitrophaceae bacterium]
MTLQESQLRLEKLIEINHLLMGTVDPKAVLKLILESAKQLFSAEACSIALIDKTHHQLNFAFSSGGADVGEFKMALGQGIIGSVASTGKGIVCNDVSTDPRFFKEVDQETGFNTQSLLCVPLKHSGETIGAIEVLNTNHPAGFTEDDLKFLNTFGGPAGAAIERALIFSSTENAKNALEEVVQNHFRFIIGQSKTMTQVMDIARRVAPMKTTVLLLGESGTGKEVMARAIHQWSPRSANPFIAVNCVALTSELMESELFGHEKGAFTGAFAQKKGKFELGQGGTIFLDEIGDLSASLQTRLLRVLQEREFQRVGGSKNIQTDVRILAATNRDLKLALEKGDFRKDLYYRLNVVSMTLPPLRERQEDIAGLAAYFVKKHCLEVKRAIMTIHPKALAFLENYTWPGNVRELQNAIERAVVLAPEPIITENDLPLEICEHCQTPPNNVSETEKEEVPQYMAEAVDHFKRTYIRKTLEKTGGNQSETAKTLGMRSSNLSRIMKQLGLR